VVTARNGLEALEKFQTGWSDGVDIIIDKPVTLLALREASRS
jgi:hypothetical protein